MPKATFYLKEKSFTFSGRHHMHVHTGTFTVHMYVWFMLHPVNINILPHLIHACVLGMYTTDTCISWSHFHWMQCNTLADLETHTNNNNINYSKHQQTHLSWRTSCHQQWPPVPAETPAPVSALLTSFSQHDHVLLVSTSFAERPIAFYAQHTFSFSKSLNQCVPQLVSFL